MNTGEAASSDSRSVGTAVGVNAGAGAGSAAIITAALRSGRYVEQRTIVSTNGLPVRSR